MAAETPQPDKKYLTESLFYMWRCVVAIAHADGTVAEAERAYIENIIANLDRVYGLDDYQRKIFQDDLAKGQNISDLLPRVTSPEDRASLIYFGDILAHADGQETPDEQAILDRLHDDVMKKVDVEKLRGEIETDLAARRATRVKEMQAIHAEEQKRHPVFGALDRLMLKMGVDMLD